MTMQCPVCKETLQLTDRQGVEIDYCAKCRGVWLDRGELQKLIDLSLAQLNQQPPQPVPLGYRPETPAYTEEHQRRYEDNRYHDRRYDPYYGKPKKRESWFSELFDFD